MKRWITIAVFAMLAAAPMATAQIPPAPPQAVPLQGDPSEPMPALPVNATWAGVAIIIIFSLFVAAACIGPIAWSEFPEEVQPLHSHDEPPGASGHHGSTGAVNPEPYHHK